MIKHASQTSWRSMIATGSLLLSCACSDAVDFVASHQGSVAFISVVEQPDGTVTAEAHRFDAVTRIAVSPDTTSTFLWYGRDLQALRLEVGPIERATDGPTRAFPRPDAVEELRFDSTSSAPRLEPIDEPSAAVLSFRLSEPTPAECAGEGGCYDAGSIDLDGLRMCVPCPAPPLPVAPAPVMPPRPPVLTPCPEGWTENRSGEFVVCDPPVRVELECPRGEVQFFGESECVPLGSECPAPGSWAPDLPSDTIFVQQDGVAGNGTQAAPFGTLEEALMASESGGTIALAEGVYVENVRLDSPISIRGACAARTTIVQSPSRSGAAIEVHASDVSLENLHVTGSTDAVVFVASERSLRLEDVWIEGTARFGLLVNGSLDADRILLQGGESVLAISAVRSQQVAVRRAIIEHSSLFGVHVLGEGAVRFDDLSIRFTSALPEIVHTAAFLVQGPLDVTVNGFEFRDNDHAAIGIDGAAEVSFEDGIIARSRQNEQLAGLGALIVTGSLEARRTVFSGNALSIQSSPSGRVLLEDVSMQGGPAQRQGGGVASSGDLEMKRVHVTTTDWPALGLVGSSTLSDLVLEVRHTRSATQGAATALELAAQSRVRANRVTVSSQNGRGALSYSDDAVLTDLFVRTETFTAVGVLTGTFSLLRADVRGGDPHPAISIGGDSVLDFEDVGFGGSGCVALGQTSKLVARRLALDCRNDLAFYLSEEAELEATDVAIENGSTDLNADATATLTRVTVNGGEEEVFRAERRSSLIVQDLRLHGTMGELQTGIFFAEDSARIVVSRFFASRPTAFGVKLEGDATVDLHAGTLSHVQNAFAVPIQYDLRRLLDGVTLEDVASVLP